MTTQLPLYKVLNGDDLGNPDYWNARFADIDRRLLAQEAIEKTWTDVLRDVTENGLQRIDQAITPLIEQLEEDAQLGALFIAESSTTLEVGAGLKTVAITSANARRFAAAAYIGLVRRQEPFALMMGPLVSYDRDTGSLVVQVETAFGEGALDGWTVSATSHIDYQADHVIRTPGARGIAAGTVEGALAEVKSGAVPVARTVSVGTGLAGGGALGGDITISFSVAWGDARYVLGAVFDTHTHAFAELTGRPTSLAGYGIGDAYSIAQVDALLAGKLSVSAAATFQPALGFTPENVAKKGVANGYAGLGADGKVPANQLPADGSYRGTWNAATNTPPIASGVGTSGDFYFVGTAGSTPVDGIGNWVVGDQLRFNGTVWQRIPTASLVSSVAGRTGAILLVAADISDAGETGRLLMQADGAAAARAAIDAAAIAHTHALAEIGGLEAALGAKLDVTATSVFGRTLASTADGAAARLALGLGSAALAATAAFAPAVHTHAEATTSAAGFMSAADKAKLNGVAANANNYVHPTGDGNQHIPATGTGNAGRVLKAGANAGTASWQFVAFDEVTGKPATLAGYGIADAYDQSTLNGLLAAKQNALGYTAENTANKGVANGYAGLDGSGKVPASQLPAIAISDTFVVNTPAAMLALTAEIGDVAVRTDLSKSFILKATPATTLANWQELLTPASPVTSVAGRTGAVTLTSGDLGDGGSFGRQLIQSASVAAARMLLDLGGLALKSMAATSDITDGAVTMAKIASSVAASQIVAEAGTAADQFLTPSGGAALIAKRARRLLLGPVSFYVSPAGNDGNDGALATPYGTIQRALDEAAKLDLGIYDVDIWLADGTYTTGGRLGGRPPGTGRIRIRGNAASPGNVIVSTISQSCFVTEDGAVLDIRDLELRTTTGGNGLEASSSSTIFFRNLRFGVVAGAHKQAASFGRIVGEGAYSIVGNAVFHSANYSGYVQCQALGTVTLAAGRTFSDCFALASLNGTTIYGGTSWSTTTATGKRYNAITGGGINVWGAGASVLPGNVAGTVTSPGWYS